MSKNCGVIAIFWIYGKFGAIRKSDSGRIICKTYIFIKSNLLSYKNWKHNFHQILFQGGCLAVLLFV